MNIISILIVLIIVGFILYLVNLAPIDATIKKIAQAVVILILILWILQIFIGGSIPVFNIRP